MADHVAASLQRDGLAPGDAVAICAGTSIRYVALFIGALRAGGLAFYAKCNTCLFVSEPYGDTTTAGVLGSVHHCD